MIRRTVLFLACLALSACEPIATARPDPREPVVSHDRPDAPLKSRNGPAIRVSNSACMGICPVWRVELRPDGRVIYQGGDNTAIKGERRWRISAGQVARIAHRARQDGFFDVQASRGGYGLDGPDTVISICETGRCRSVRALPDRPMLMGDLRREIVDVSGVASYVTADLQTLALLKEEGFDFRSEHAGCLLAKAAMFKQKDVALALIARGAPLTVRCDEGMGTQPPLWGASSDPDPTVLNALVKAGAVRQTRPYDLVTLIDRLEGAGRKDQATALRKAGGLTQEKEAAIRRDPAL